MNPPSDPPPEPTTRTGLIGLTVPVTRAETGTPLPAPVVESPGEPEAEAGELRRRLMDVNLRAVAPAERRAWLEAVRPKMVALAERLDERPADQLVPASIHQEGAGALLEALADGYKLLAEEFVETATGNADTLAMVLARTLDALGRRLLYSYRHFSQPPAGLWLEIHRLYRFVLHRRIEEVSVPDPLGTGDPHSPAQAYGRLLLATLANPFSLRPATLDLLQELLWNWAGQVRVAPPEAGTGRFLVELNQDAPPVPREPGTASTPEQLLLDTAPLVRALAQLLAAPAEPGREWLSGPLLRHLVQMWGEPATARSRRHPRTERSMSVEVVLGLPAIHTLIGPRAAGGRSPVVHACRTADTSLGGYRLLWETPSAELQPGLLLALGVAQGNERRWFIGVVRWLQRQSGQPGFALGVQLLAARAEAAQCEDGDVSVDCLLLPALPAIGLPRSLLLPSSRYRPGEELQVVVGEAREPVRLQELASASDHYSQYLLAEMS